MALNFTDSQINKVTNDIIGLPAVIAKFEEDKADQVAREEDLLKTDEQNTVFSDNAISINDAYHDELVPLKGDQRAGYTNADIEAGSQKSNDHFPLTWVNYEPQLIDSNNGIPITPDLLIEEDPRLVAEKTLSVLFDGFTDGAISDTLDSAYTIGQPLVVVTGGFSIGERVVVEGGGQGLLGIIDAIGPVSGGSCSGEDNPPQLTEAACLLDNGIWTPSSSEGLTLIFLTDENVILPAGSTVKNFHPGYSNAQRESATVSDFLGAIKAQTEVDLALYKPFLETQNVALNNNSDTGVDKTQNTAALANVDLILDGIINFEGAPASGSGVGKFGDTVLLATKTAIIARPAQIAPRIAEIEASLGTVSQSPDGSFSGPGRYFDLFKWVDLRLNIAAGSLRQYLDIQMAIEFFSQSITGAENQLEEYEDIFLVKQFAIEGDSSEFVELSDVTGLAVSDTVMAMDNDSAVINRVISDIQGNVVELDSAIGVNLALNKLARLVKRL